MRHNLTLFAALAVMASLAGGCASRTARIQQARADRLAAVANAPAVTEQDVLAKQIAELQVAPPNETVTDRRVRLRALQILTEQLKKQTDRELAATDTPALRRARQEVEKEDRHDQAIERESGNVLGRAAISGCPVDSVKINARAVDSTVRWFSLLPAVSVRIINATPFYQDIETPNRGIGVAVQNLCPGGGVTLTFAKPPVGSPYENIYLTAVTRQGGLPYTARTFTLYLNATNVQYERVSNQVWTIY